jgi:hypothetical protein
MFLHVGTRESTCHIDEVTNCLQISHGSVYEIIHNRSGFQKVYKMGPKTTQYVVYANTLGQYQQHLNCCGNERDALLDRISLVMKHESSL